MSAAGVNLSGKDRDISIFMPVVIVFLKRVRKEVFVVILVEFDSSHYQKQIQISLMVRRALLVYKSSLCKGNLWLGGKTWWEDLWARRGRKGKRWPSVICKRWTRGWARQYCQPSISIFWQQHRYRISLRLSISLSIVFIFHFSPDGYFPLKYLL